MHNILCVGEIVNTHGVKGELKVIPLVDNADDLVDYSYYLINGEKYEGEMKENELYEFNDNGITENYNADVTDIKYFAELYKGSVTENTPVDRRKLLHAFNVKYNLPDDELDRNYSRNRNLDSWSR